MISVVLRSRIVSERLVSRLTYDTSHVYETWNANNQPSEQNLVPVLSREIAGSLDPYVIVIHELSESCSSIVVLVRGSHRASKARCPRRCGAHLLAVRSSKRTQAH